ncbi:MAG: DinB family protein [Acidobacteriaceae bacterium]|nr:DinB family protein [Acidobacteriaceae bacterium]
MKKLLFAFGLAGVQVFAQSSSSTPAAPNPNPLSAATKYMYGMSKGDVLKSAEEMPEENYSFKPVSTVRSFGQLVGHVADAQYEFCSAVVGDGKQPPGIEKSKTSKADLIQGLKDAFAYCDQAYSSMTDAQAPVVVKFFNHDAPKLSILNFNVVHNMEHYGNMVTYLRIKGLVPPSSQQQSMQ